MLDALDVCGARSGEEVRGGLVPGRATKFDARLAGTTSRFLSAVSALSPDGVVIDGEEPLRRRPMQDLHDALRVLGADVSALGSDEGFLPVRISRGRLGGGAVDISGDVSSQFVSALMLIGPMLEGGLDMRVRGELVSRPYVEMTAAVMRVFGASVTVTGSQVQVEEGGYRGTDYTVEPDFSAAAFPVMALAHGTGTIRLPDLALARLQGDRRILDLARQMGITVSIDGDDVVCSRPAGSAIAPLLVDLRDESDLVPAVAVACAAAPGISRLTGVGFVRNKESNRIADVARGLRILGADTIELEDGLEIHGTAHILCSGVLDTKNDHRLAMAFALCAAGGTPVLIDDPTVVTKSWPGYFDDMRGVLGSLIPAY